MLPRRPNFRVPSWKILAKLRDSDRLHYKMKCPKDRVYRGKNQNPIPIRSNFLRLLRLFAANFLSPILGSSIRAIREIRGSFSDRVVRSQPFYFRVFRVFRG